jgi:hypothetical protein
MLADISVEHIASIFRVQDKPSNQHKAACKQSYAEKFSLVACLMLFLAWLILGP